METAERGAAWLLLAIVLLVGFGRAADFTTERGRGWQVAIYLIGLACLAAAGVLLVAAIAPSAIVQLPMEQRARFVFFAFALLIAEILTILLLRAYSVYYLHEHGPVFGSSG